MTYFGWDWEVRIYYGKKAQLPRVTGHLACATTHKGENSKDLEVLVSSKRQDIGRVDVRNLREHGMYETVWSEE